MGNQNMHTYAWYSDEQILFVKENFLPPCWLKALVSFWWRYPHRYNPQPHVFRSRGHL